MYLKSKKRVPLHPVKCYPKTPTDLKENKSCHVICFLDDSCVQQHTTFFMSHCQDKFDHGCFVFIMHLFIRTHMHCGRYMVDVSQSAVLCSWCPCANYRGYRVTLVSSYVSTKNHESGTQAIVDGHELLKIGVRGVGNLSQPGVTDSDIEWVVVANAAWFFFHIVPPA